MNAMVAITAPMLPSTLGSSHRTMQCSFSISLLTTSSEGYESFHWFMLPLARMIFLAFLKISINAGMSSYVAFLIIEFKGRKYLVELTQIFCIFA